MSLNQFLIGYVMRNFWQADKCVTQNANESLHHVIWGLCPRKQYTSSQECSLALSLDVLLFNNGMKAVYSKLVPNLGINVTLGMLNT